MTTAKTTFFATDQERFRDLSGDANPIHMDALYARRTQAGEPVVHGIHSLLWALEEMGATRDEVESGLNARFENFLYLNRPVELSVSQVEKGRAALIESDDQIVTSLRFGKPVADKEIRGGETNHTIDAPADLTFEQAADAAGTIQLAGSDAEFADNFPSLSAEIGARRVRAIANLSTLVGMVAPGLHSIFSKCSIASCDEENEELAFEVRRANKVFRSLSLAVCGGGIVAELDAFVRRPPIEQPHIADLAALETERDYYGARALVIGGSRGLGALTAKLLALRGAQVVVTYFRGRDDAESVVREINEHGGACEIAQFDSAKPELDLLRDGAFTHLFFFATPPIFSRKSAGFSEEAFDNFVAVYCHDFRNICEAMAQAGPFKAFWPSSTAIDEKLRQSAEYVMAKSAGEALCGYLNKNQPNIRILAPRLPRLDTDQTSTVMPIKSEDAVSVVRATLDQLAAL